MNYPALSLHIQCHMYITMCIINIHVIYNVGCTCNFVYIKGDMAGWGGGCTYTLSCRCTCIYLCLIPVSFKFLYPFLPVFTCLYLCLPVFICVLPVFTCVYLYLPVFTCSDLYLPVFTCLYLSLPVFTCVYL